MEQAQLALTLEGLEFTFPLVRCAGGQDHWLTTSACGETTLPRYFSCNECVAMCLRYRMRCTGREAGADSPWLQFVLPSALGCGWESLRARAAPLRPAARSYPLLSPAVLAMRSPRRDRHANCELRAPSCEVISADARFGNCNLFLAFIAFTASLAMSCGRPGPIIQMYL